LYGFQVFFISLSRLFGYDLHTLDTYSVIVFVHISSWIDLDCGVGWCRQLSMMLFVMSTMFEGVDYSRWCRL